MSKFLTMKEAAQLVGKSPSSIRRILYPILEESRHPDRHHIEPDVATVKALRSKGEIFAWKISEELLRREVPNEEPKSSAESKAGQRAQADGSIAIVQILRQELEIKNQQIAAQNQQMTNQNELMKGLSERLREGNILIGSLQKQLSLSDGSGRNATESPDSKTEESPKQGSHVAPPKKTHWLFKKIF